MLVYLQLQGYREDIAAERNLNEKAKEVYLAAQEHKNEAARAGWQRVLPLAVGYLR